MPEPNPTAPQAPLPESSIPQSAPATPEPEPYNAYAQQPYDAPSPAPAPAPAPQSYAMGEYGQPAYPPQPQAQTAYPYPPQAQTAYPYPPQQPVPQYGAPYGYPQPGYVNPADSGSFGWAVLGFFVPVAGLILWLVWKDQRPRDATMAGKGALVSVIVWAAFVVLYIIFVIVIIVIGISAASAAAIIA